jgi:hypothetical protein
MSYPGSSGSGDSLLQGIGPEYLEDTRIITIYVRAVISF